MNQMTHRRAQLQPRLLPYLLLVPAFLIAGIVLVYPLVNGIVLSLTSYSLIEPGYRWVGLANFRDVLSDPVYWEVFRNSILIIFAAVAVQLIVGLAVALLLNTQVPLQGVFRSSVFVIWIIPQIVISLLWMVMYNSEYGILNYVLKRLGLIGQYINWLGRPWPAQAAHIITHGWRGVPFFMVMILAALQTIPSDIVDAALIDGAGTLQRFWVITIPFIRHIVLLSCLLSVVRLFQDITLTFILTQGGPVYATTTLGVHVYKEAFVGFQMGRAAAIGVTWLLFLVLLAVAYVRMVTRTEFRK
jgi:multiple sugar transport system permease protein